MPLPLWPLLALGAAAVGAFAFVCWVSRKEREAWAEHGRAVADLRAAVAALSRPSPRVIDGEAEQVPVVAKALPSGPCR